VIPSQRSQSTPATTEWARPVVSHVIFDFDGTLSWLRNGWPDIMAEGFAKFLPSEHRHSEAVRKLLRREILALNGRPSIHQMQRFCELAPGFDASPPHPQVLLDLYLACLKRVLRRRIDSLDRRETLPQSFVIAGAFTLLDELRQRGMRLIILSGTTEADVRREAQLLGLGPYFGEHIYGSTPGKDFSKKEVIARILREERIEGAGLLSFGDGPVEIESTKAVGGWAVGVASDERANGSGVLDPDKHEQLLRAGADAIIPDYRNTDWILEKFFP
jgi:phosphoglycolate phosphatase